MAGARMSGRWVSAGHKKAGASHCPQRTGLCLFVSGGLVHLWLCWLGNCVHSDGKHSSQTEMRSAGTVNTTAACI